jgi:hypothetical protein
MDDLFDLFLQGLLGLFERLRQPLKGANHPNPQDDEDDQDQQQDNRI